MSKSGYLESRTPLLPVNADDLKRVWVLMQKVIADHGLGIGIDVSLISQQCAPGADVNAVFFRAALPWKTDVAGSLPSRQSACIPRTSEMTYSGWEATVNGAPQTLLMTNGAVRGLP